MTKYEDLDYEDIHRLAGEYNNYIMEFNEENRWKTGSEPVSIYEFYEHEYQEIIAEEE